MIPLERPRRGITLMEVLIATGILAVGLGSVAALIPAGRSQAARAVVLDRAALLAANALADAATFGLLRPDSHAGTLAPNFAVMIDPATTGTNYIKTGQNGVISGLGIFSSPSTATKAEPAYHRLFAEARDDIVVQADPNPAAEPDDLPISRFDRTADGVAVVRSYEGRFTCMYFLQIGPPPGSLGRMSVVVFHRRDTSPNAVLAVKGTIANGAVTVDPTVLGDRSLSEIAKPGVVVYVNDSGIDRFFQATAATVDSAGKTVFLTLQNATRLQFKTATEITFLPDSVGLAERTFVPEGIGAFVQ